MPYKYKSFNEYKYSSINQPTNRLHPLTSVSRALMSIKLSRLASPRGSSPKSSNMLSRSPVSKVASAETGSRHLAVRNAGWTVKASPVISAESPGTPETQQRKVGEYNVCSNSNHFNNPVTGNTPATQQRKETYGEYVFSNSKRNVRRVIFL